MAEELDTTWFNLRKYDAVKSFKAADWYFQLEKRKVIRDYVQIYIEKKIQCGGWMDPWYENNCKKCIESIKAQPIFVNEKQEPPSLSVRDALISDLDCVRHNDHVNVSNLSFDEFINNFRSQPITPRPLIPASSYKVMLTIDINASNAQLKKEFNEWLKSYRMSVKEEFNNWHDNEKVWLDSVANNPKGNPNDPLVLDKNMVDQRLKNLGSYKKLAHSKDREELFEIKKIEQWHKHRILPYLDLVLIAKATEKKLTQIKIANVLYNDLKNEDITKYIRDNPSKLAKTLLDEKTLEALRVQAKSKG